MFHMKEHRREAGRITGRRGAALPAGRLARLSLGAAVFSGAAAGAALAGARLAARRFGTPEEKETRFLTPWELGLPYEDVAFRTEDGLRLGAWWLPNPQAQRTVVILSGHNGARQDTLGIGGALYRAGSNVLLLDNRGGEAPRETGSPSGATSGSMRGPPSDTPSDAPRRSRSRFSGTRWAGRSR